jgi:hypothetical protein
LLATGVTHYPGMVDRDLVSIAEDLRRVVELFTARLGYQEVPALGMNPTAEQLRFALEDLPMTPIGVPMIW